MSILKRIIGNVLHFGTLLSLIVVEIEEDKNLPSQWTWHQF
jgi:hypothetical protein